MKVNRFYTFIIALFLLVIPGVNASSCSYEEQAQLNSSVAHIKVIYEEKEGVVDTSLYECQEEDPDCVSKYNYFEISILNMTKDFYIVVTNNVDNETKTLTYADAVDGIIKFDWDGIMTVTTFTFKVMSSSSTNCVGDTYRTIYLTTPRKNLYHYYGQCQATPDFYMCDKYVTFDELDFYDFINKIEEYENKKASAEEEKQDETPSQIVKDFFKENKITIIAVGGIVGVLLMVLVVTLIRKRKKSVL